MANCFVDLHCDTLLTMWQNHCGLDAAPGHIDLAKLCGAGTGLQCFAAFLPTYDSAAKHGVEQAPWDFFRTLAGIFERETARFPAQLRPVRSVADFEENRRAGRVSALLTLEDAVCLEGRMERLYALYERGVRMIALTWNYENSVGFPNSPDPALHAKGLKDFGREVVEEMGRLGMAVDVSHLSEGGFWDVAALCRGPFVASHSCARALCDHSRNLTDAQLRALGEHGGVCGVNFYSRFLREGAEHTAFEDILRHMAHIADKAGIEAVALGSDFDGIDCTLELKDYGGLVPLAERIADRFGADDAERICSGNALRVLRDTIG